MSICSRSPRVRKAIRTIKKPARPYPDQENAVKVYLYTQEQAEAEGWGGAGGIAVEGQWVKLKIGDTFPDYYARAGFYHTDEVLKKGMNQVSNGEGRPRAYYVGHELWHVFGVDHDYPNSIMNASMRPVSEKQEAKDWKECHDEVIRLAPSIQVIVGPNF